MNLLHSSSFDVPKNKLKQLITLIYLFIYLFFYDLDTLHNLGQQSNKLSMAIKFNYVPTINKILQRRQLTKFFNNNGHIHHHKHNKINIQQLFKVTNNPNYF